MDVRRIAKIAGYAVRQPQAFQDHLLDMCEHMCRDPGACDEAMALYRGMEGLAQSVSAWEEARRPGMTPASIDFASRISEMICHHAPDRGGDIVDILSAEIVHRETWKEAWGRTPAMQAALRIGGTKNGRS